MSSSFTHVVTYAVFPSSLKLSNKSREWTGDYQGLEGPGNGELFNWYVVSLGQDSKF